MSSVIKQKSTKLKETKNGNETYSLGTSSRSLERYKEKVDSPEKVSKGNRRKVLNRKRSQSRSKSAVERPKPEQQDSISPESGRRQKKLKNRGRKEGSSEIGVL